MTAAMKLTVDMETVRVLLLPAASSPRLATCLTRTSPMSTWSTPSTSPPVVDKKNIETVSAPPTVGTWLTGEVLGNSAGDFYKCTAGGTPGTWVPI